MRCQTNAPSVTDFTHQREFYGVVLPVTDAKTPEGGNAFGYIGEKD